MTPNNHFDEMFPIDACLPDGFTFGGECRTKEDYLELFAAVRKMMTLKGVEPERVFLSPSRDLYDGKGTP